MFYISNYMFCTYSTISFSFYEVGRHKQHSIHHPLPQPLCHILQPFPPPATHPAATDLWGVQASTLRNPAGLHCCQITCHTGDLWNGQTRPLTHSLGPPLIPFAPAGPLGNSNRYWAGGSSNNTAVCYFNYRSRQTHANIMTPLL